MKEKFARWDILLLQYLKRDWKKIIIWILGIGLFSAGYMPAFKEIAKGEGAMGMYETLKNPAMIAMIGPTPVKSALDYSLGAMYAHEMLLFCGLASMIVSALHIVSHTRKEEELGLSELIRSFQVGRQANSFAVIIEIVIINLILVLFIAVIMISYQVDSVGANGSFLFAASIGIAGKIGAVMALVMSQIMPTSSAATGSSLGIVGILYLIRASTDVSNVSLSMINPMGWIYLTYPFTENNWLPVILAVIFSFIMVILAFSLEGARDMGAGYLPEREGPERAKKSMLSVRGLFIKLNKGVIISWLIAFVIMGAAYGSIYSDMHTFLNSNDIMKQMFTQAGFTIEESFTGTIMMVMMALVSILPIAIVNKLFAEEVKLHLSQLFATKVTRVQLYWVNIILATIVGEVAIFLSAGALGITAFSVMGQSLEMNMMDFFAAGYNFLPSVLFFIGLAALALGWKPRMGKAIYGYLAYSFAVNYFGKILDLPEWLSKIAVLSWIPQMPIEKFDGVIFITLTVISVILMVLGYIGYNKRDMLEGA